jgi:hypothetical protein
MSMIKMALFAVGLLLCCSCVTNRSGVIQDGADTYSVIHVGKTGFVSSGDLKVAAYREAAAHCSRLGRALEVIGSDEQQGGVLGKFPQAQVRFRCLPSK